jgi:hypothetical protein
MFFLEANIFPGKFLDILWKQDYGQVEGLDWVKTHTLKVIMAPDLGRD